jgi:hypothetical protein
VVRMSIGPAGGMVVVVGWDIPPGLWVGGWDGRLGGGDLSRLFS